MKSAPAFQFYPGDYLRSQRVQLLTLEEEGAYVRLLSYCWLHGSIPSNPGALARLIGKGASTTLATTLATMFQAGETPDRLIHDRLEAERQKQAIWSQKSAEGGRKSAEMRANRKNNPTVVQPPHQPNGNQRPTLQSAVSGLHTAESLRPPAAERPRNPLFDELAAIDGSDPLKLTKSAGARVGQALAQIKAVCPELTVDEIKRRAARYKRLHPDWTLSASAIAKHWASLGTPISRNPTALAGLPPPDWRTRLEELHPGNLVNSEGRAWETLPEQTRKEITA